MKINVNKEDYRSYSTDLSMIDNKNLFLILIESSSIETNESIRDRIFRENDGKGSHLVVC